MKILIYTSNKNEGAIPLKNKIEESLKKINIDFVNIDDFSLSKKMIADCLIVIGGDGTILHVKDFASKNNIPIVGINAGKLGYLTEYEGEEYESLVYDIKNNSFKKDSRLLIETKVNDEVFLALNDAVVSRIYDDKLSGVVASLLIYIDNTKIENIVGDGVIISTPTGSTAYSLSAGGAILAPGINGLSLTPIAAHSLCLRPVIFSADSICDIFVNNIETATGLSIDGKIVCKLKNGTKVSVKKSDKSIVFLRKSNSNFYERLVDKLGGKNSNRNDKGGNL